MSLLLKEERVAECLMSCGRVFQRWGPKCEKIRKPWVLLLKPWSLSMLTKSGKSVKERKGAVAQKDKEVADPVAAM